jgi:hypothetical protein
MAALYADVGKAGEDLLKDGFPSVNRSGVAQSSFETEVNAKGSNGVKFQVTTSTDTETGRVSATLKPTIPFTAGGDVNGDVKVALSTSSATKVDFTSTFGAVAGLKAKAGFTDANVNGGFDYTSGSVFSNVKLDYPIRHDKPVSIEAASVFAHGKFSFGGKVVYLVGGAAQLPELEGKLAVTNPDFDVVLTGKRNSDKAVNFYLTYFHQLNSTRAIAAKASFVPGQSSLAEKVNIQFAVSHKLNPDTTVKARYNTGAGAEKKSSAGFSVAHKLNSNLNVELGTEFPTALNGGSVYNVKFVFNQ